MSPAQTRLGALLGIVLSCVLHAANANAQGETTTKASPASETEVRPVEQRSTPRKDGATEAAENAGALPPTNSDGKPPYDITHEEYRTFRDSAYSLPARTASVRLGMLGTGFDEVFASLAFDYGLGHGLQLGINLLHASAGVINLSAQWTFFERGPVALSARFAPTWIHGNWVWLKRNSEIVGNIDILNFPFALAVSYLPVKWFELDFTAGYTHSEIFGDLNSSSLAFDAGIGMRGVRLTPVARFHIERRLSLFFRAHLPVYTAIPGAVEGSITLAEGVEVGARSKGTTTIPFDKLYVLSMGARAMASRHVFLSFLLNYGALAETLYRNAWSPSFNVEGRF